MDGAGCVGERRRQCGVWGTASKCIVYRYLFSVAESQWGSPTEAEQRREEAIEKV